MWYPSDKQELDDFIEKSFKQKINLKKFLKKIHGLIVPHAGYEYSGLIAGKAFSLLQDKKFEKAILIGPSHYQFLNNAVTSNKKYLETPLGNIHTFNLGFQEFDISQEHSMSNQAPFLQKIGIREIMPLMVGKITDEQALEIAKKISNIENCVYIFSTDLSHFYTYEKAIESDKRTIKILENLDFENFKFIDACGYFPLLILMHLCKILKTKPHLIEYKNSGDITGDKSNVVGYASFVF